MDSVNVELEFWSVKECDAERNPLFLRRVSEFDEPTLLELLGRRRDRVPPLDFLELLGIVATPFSRGEGGSLTDVLLRTSFPPPPPAADSCCCCW